MVSLSGQKVAETKLVLADIQKQMLSEEIENKRKLWLFEEKERQHESKMWALEKQLLQKEIE